MSNKITNGKSIKKSVGIGIDTLLKSLAESAPGRKQVAPLLRQTCPLARSAAYAALAAAGMRANGGRLQIGMSPGWCALCFVHARMVEKLGGVDVGLLAQTQTAARLAAGRHSGGPKVGVKW